MHSYLTAIPLIAFFVISCTSTGAQKSVVSQPDNAAANTLAFQSKPIQFSSQPQDFHLQLLHNSDQESGIAVLNDLPRFAKALDVLKKKSPILFFFPLGTFLFPDLFSMQREGRATFVWQTFLGTRHPLLVTMSSI